MVVVIKMMVMVRRSEHIVGMTCERRNAIIIHHPKHELSPPMLVHCHEEELFCLQQKRSPFLESSFSFLKEELLKTFLYVFYIFNVLRALIDISNVSLLTLMSGLILIIDLVNICKILEGFHPNILQTSAFHFCPHIALV